MKFPKILAPASHQLRGLMFVVNVGAASTCRFAERLFLFLFSLFIFLCLTEFLCKECPRVHIHFERVDIKEIPAEPLFFRRWLHERFEIKDR